jgi:hypothetical protein
MPIKSQYSKTAFQKLLQKYKLTKKNDITFFGLYEFWDQH